ncbi:hypothetical protein, partial [Nocardia cyriacigeorgica]|uniref:hypothetical protein n=1 Tax=Nocardia cyriacigeorgica TaxID=135487 RepID=UPI0024569A1F
RAARGRRAPVLVGQALVYGGLGGPGGGGLGGGGVGVGGGGGGGGGGGAPGAGPPRGGGGEQAGTAVVAVPCPPFGSPVLCALAKIINPLLPATGSVGL